MLVKDALRKMFPHASSTVLQAMAVTFPAARKKYNINANLLAFALGQVKVESGGLTVFTENLHYSAAGLTRIFGVGRSSAKVTPAEARRLAENPQAIAMRVYGTGKKAHDLGNIKPIQGWIYRGSGPIQITGLSAFEAVSRLTGVDFVNDPDKARNPAYFWDIIFGFFHWKGAMNYMRETPITYTSIEHISRVTNGGTTELAERETATKQILALIHSTKILTLGNDDDNTPVAIVNEDEVKPAEKPEVLETQDDIKQDIEQDAGIDTLTSSESVKPSNRVLAEYGDENNPHVLKLQHGLNELHYWNGTPDGDFNTLTRSSLLAFQADNGFDVESVLRQKHIDRLTIAHPRPISDERRNATTRDIHDSLTVRISKRLQSLAAIGLSYMGIDASVDDGWGGIAAKVFGQHDTITEFLRPIFTFVSSPTHLKIVIALCAIATIYMAYHIIKERVDTHKNASNLHR